MPHAGADVCSANIQCNTLLGSLSQPSSVLAIWTADAHPCTAIWPSSYDHCRGLRPDAASGSWGQRLLLPASQEVGMGASSGTQGCCLCPRAFQQCRRHTHSATLLRSRATTTAPAATAATATTTTTASRWLRCRSVAEQQSGPSSREGCGIYSLLCCQIRSSSTTGPAQRDDCLLELLPEGHQHLAARQPNFGRLGRWGGDVASLDRASNELSVYSRCQLHLCSANRFFEV
mmetsp:Transcript_54829/g.117069  ORF Transcript_54829/g.117069 Transcript_54829/m.117069 type:complete len:232 (+) Transcript_54829:1064-1759(+)